MVNVREAIVTGEKAANNFDMLLIWIAIRMVLPPLSVLRIAQKR